jgi:peptidoglycan/LPS O-acetylase OafA/YrhL
MAKPLEAEPIPMSEPTPVGRPSLHLTHLDGIRGLAALYVVAHHAYLECTGDSFSPHLSKWECLATNWLQFGHISVSIFIVLSGYCLMLPVARVPARFDLRTFLFRRAKRILPPYYAALLATLGLTLLLPCLRYPHAGNWAGTQPAIAIGPIVSHLLLLQDMSPAWMYKISHPMWSVAVEWQIYFVFALIMIPLWRRFGIWSVLVATFAAGYALDRFGIANTCSHYMFLFALGMLGALIGYSDDPDRYKRWLNLPWLPICLAATALFVVLSRGTGYWLIGHSTTADTIIGVATVSLLVLCDIWAKRPSTARPVVLLSVLRSRAVVGLGAFSYSLYLIHAPVVALVYDWLCRFGLSTWATLLLELGICVPLCVGIAYLFYLPFERPFLNTRPGGSRRT